MANELSEPNQYEITSVLFPKSFKIGHICMKGGSILFLSPCSQNKEIPHFIAGSNITTGGGTVKNTSGAILQPKKLSTIHEVSSQREGGLNNMNNNNNTNNMITTHLTGRVLLPRWSPIPVLQGISLVDVYFELG